jgi:hypothetical protein
MSKIPAIEQTKPVLARRMGRKNPRPPQVSIVDDGIRHATPPPVLR